MLPFGNRFLAREGGLDEGKRILEGKIDYLSAMIADIEDASFSASIQHSEKRKKDDDDAFFSSLIAWVTKGWELVQQSRSFLGQDGEGCSEKKRTLGGGFILSFQSRAKVEDVYKLIQTLSDHEKEADDMRLGWTLFEGGGPSCGTPIPVRELFGQVSSDALKQLRGLLQSDEVSSVAICGIQGIGKTLLMKHLHNCTLNWADRFDYIFWVTFPRQFSAVRVQSELAAAVKCNLPSDEDLNVRAETLSEFFGGLRSYVLFLDNVPEAHFSLAQIGIPVPAEGSKSKLVLTTRSTLVCKMLNCMETVNLGRLSDEDACQFFMNEAEISMGNASLLKNISESFAQKCHGVPRMIIDIATRMRGIDDPHEWRNALFEFR